MKNCKTIYFLLFFFLGSVCHNSLSQTQATLDATLNFKSVNGVDVAFQNGIPVPSYEKQKRTTINLAGTWKKLRFAASDDISLAKRDQNGMDSLLLEAGGKEQASYDDNSWETKHIPSVENFLYLDTIRTPEFYQDGVWYRYNFSVPDSLQGKFVKLIFYSVNYVADVWINGQYCGYHEGGYTPFAFDVSSKLHYGATQNTIAVRVDNPAWAKRNDIVPYKQCDWFNYTGIIHDVYLEASDVISVSRVDFKTDAAADLVNFTGVVLNKSGASKNVTVNVQVYNANIDSTNISDEKTYDLLGSPKSSRSFQLSLADSVATFSGDFPVSEFNLWSMASPTVYIAKITVEENGNQVDEFYTQFGVRKIQVNNAKILLNGNPIFLAGVARHEDHPLYGRSVPTDTIFTDLERIKKINAVFVRTAHYPNHPYTYLINDRLGLAAWEEIPVFWFDEVESWNIQNNVRHIHQQMFREMVLKDFNRPSILLWSTQNESLIEAERKTYIDTIHSDYQLHFNDGRLITESAAADRPGPTDVSQQACDVAAWTMYFGVFYNTNNYYSGTSSFLAQAKVNHPGKPILDSEFGYWSSEDGSSTAKQLTVFNETYKAFKLFATISDVGTYNDKGFLNGITWWCMYDWYTAGQKFGFQSMGLMSMDRTWLKPIGETVRTTYQNYRKIGGMVTGVEDEKPLAPKRYSLNQNYPNPFNPSTIVTYQLAEKGLVTLKIYDLLGKEISVLVNEEQEAGNHRVEIKTDQLIKDHALASGVYFYQLKAGSFVQTKKMILLR